MRHHIVAIDTGSNGGICSVIYEGDKPVAWELDKLQGDNDADAYDSIHTHLGITPDLRAVYVERPPYFMGTMIPSSRIAVLFECYGKVLGYLQGRGIANVSLVDARIWQEPVRDALGYKRGKTKHSEWKKSLTQHAKASYPDVAGLTNQTADAILLARWAHLKHHSQ